MIKVLIIDDSEVILKYLEQVLNSDPDIKVIGTVSSGWKALDFINRMKPDVITMDINMPEMDGYELTRRIMEANPIPIVVVSAIWNPKEVAHSFKAVDAGAVAVLSKPPGSEHPDHAEEIKKFISTVKLMSGLNLVRRWSRKASVFSPSLPVQPELESNTGIIAIGASTGGPHAIRQFLSLLPEDFPVPILIVQHMTKDFTIGFIEWLNTFSPIPVCIATHDEPIWNNRVYLAPDARHMGVATVGRISLSEEKPENSFRPSVSHLFRSVAKVYRNYAAGVLLTGMGMDGSAELKLIRNAGGVTFAQDEESSIVYGMPGEAVKIGAATHILPPDRIASCLVGMVMKRQALRKEEKFEHGNYYGRAV